MKKQVWPKSTLPELRAAAQDIARLLPPRCTVLLDGEMGVGKTTFVRMLAEACGNNEASSPTFAIHQTYLVSGNGRIEHFDLYRLNGEDEIETSGLWDVLASEHSQQWVLIEWPQRIDPSWLSGVVFKLSLTSTALELSSATNP